MAFFISQKTALIACLLAIFIFPSCKKGPEDPEISFRSRKARLVGEWRLKSGNAGLTLLDPKNPPYAQGFVFDGTKATASETYGGGTPTIYIFAYLIDLSIKKDGTFSLTETYGSKTLVANGRWNFLSRVGKYKNKEEVAFIIDKITNDETYGHLFNKQSMEFTYHLVGLKNKEMKIEAGTLEYMNTDGSQISFTATYELIQ